MNVCTIIARNYAAHARVLAESFREIHPEGTCSVLVIDDPDGYLDAASEPFELLTLEQIGLPDPERMAAAYDVMELSTAVKPWLLRHLLLGSDEPVAYLDPDIRIFAPLDEIDRRAREHDVVLTPHFTTPLPRDGLKPSEEDILIAGTYNLGFIGLGGGETSHALLDWWSERLEKDCLNDPEHGHFVDQRWIDLAPGLWPGIDVLRDTSFNIAYWNLATRKLEADGDGYLVDGEPLRFFHFSGFDPRRPEELSRHQNRVDVPARPALARICREYAEALREKGFDEAIGWPYGWAELPGGIRLDRAARRVFRDGFEAGTIEGSVFAEAGAEQLVAYMTSPAARPDVADGLNRYAEALWESRSDFRRAFRNIDGRNGADFVSWLHLTSPETDVSADLLPASGSTGEVSEPLSRPAPGVNLVGYLSSERGVGEAARQIGAALEATGFPLVEIDSPAEPERIPEVLGGLTEAEHPYDFNLICVNADMLPVLANGLGADFFKGRHTTGVWFWEISQFPEQWHQAFDYVDEVWVASEHIAEALRRISPTPVQTIRLPIVPVPPETAGRAELGMPEGFCFLFLFDYRSVFNRKNPLGLVEAFGRAFEPGSGPSLVIKSICGDEFPAQRQALADAVAERPEIHLIEDNTSAERKNAMVAACDCYVSLHRSEGLGLTMAEAMYFGKPVIATAYSGNLDFMTEQNSYLVPHEMVEIGPGADPYPAEDTWAEPDLDRAAELMRRVFENPGEAAARAELGTGDIRRRHSPAAVGEELRERIERGKRERLIGRLQAPAPAQAVSGAPSGRYLLEHLLHFPEPPPQRGAGRLRSAAKRGYMRLLRPYSAHQQMINDTIAESIDELREALSESLRMDAEDEQKPPRGG